MPPPPDYQQLYAEEAAKVLRLYQVNQALEIENDRFRRHLAALLRDFPAHRE